MKRPVSKSLLLGISLAIRLLLFTQASLAADAECSSDSGIPSGVIATIDVGHLRKSLADAGFTIGGFYLGETFGNTGGTHQSETYDGVLWTYLFGDLHKAGLWKGLCFCADAYQIHGRSITADNIGSLVMVSNYEALPSTRLSELWLEQYLFFRHSWVSFPNPTPFGLLRTVLSGFGLRRSYSTLCTSPRPKSLMRRSRIWASDLKSA